MTGSTASRVSIALPSIKQALIEGTARLEAAGVDEARRTAGVILCHVLGVERTQLLTASSDSISEADYLRFTELVARRAAGEPVQYITGHQEFYGLDFIVTPDVLIPRPETEFLVERVLKLIPESKGSPPLVADIGTGSGCIAIAAAVNAPGARVIATDVSQAALEVAARNAERHQVQDRITFLAGDLFAPLAGLENAIDILASNPPYVSEGRPDLIQREVREWEPPVALFGGSEGLEFYRRLLSEGDRFVKPEGFMVFEIGYSQFETIIDMIAPPWELIDVTRDLQGIPRTLTLRKSSDDSRPSLTGC
jgi:release factor glutamine methyltransferase